MALKILATGDIHIGKRSSSVPSDDPESAAKFTWIRIVDLAIKDAVDVLVLTGDVVDQDNRYFEAIGPLQSGFEKLKQAGITVYMVAGNHDHDVLPQLVNPERYDNVHFLGANGKWENITFEKNEEKIQFVGWSFPSRHFSEDPLSTFEQDDIDPSFAAIGLVHGDVGVADSNYAPIDLNNFLNTRVQAWILGHIHKPQTLRESDPIVCYPGSPHALSAKEQGKHGPILITVRSKEDIQVTPIPLSPVRYERISIDISEYEKEADVRDAVTNKLLEDAQSKTTELENVSFLVYDIVIEGRHSKIRELESWLVPIVADYDQEIDATETRLSVRKVSVNAQAKVDNMEEQAQESSPAGVLAKTIIALEKGKTTDFLDDLIKAWYSDYEVMKKAGAYQPLRPTSGSSADQAPDAKEYILNECNRLLGELLEQQTE